VIRVGLGFDVHRFSEDPDRPLVLGGVTIPDAPGLIGHSDADALAHAAADALLGAAGLGDLGRLFPDDDPAWADADSMDLLATVVARVTADGHRAVNVDATVVTEAPRLSPHRSAMEATMTGVVGAPVNVKATRAEGLGAVGRVEGLACLAVALIESA
jgi:2-C-methyl-D-erythritol 2,4-cyclodiphosphate synthase